LAVLEAQASKMPVLAALTTCILEVVHDCEKRASWSLLTTQWLHRPMPPLLTYPELAWRVAEATHAQIVARDNQPPTASASKNCTRRYSTTKKLTHPLRLPSAELRMDTTSHIGPDQST
jgi:hypothetical protein